MHNGHEEHEDHNGMKYNRSSTIDVSYLTVTPQYTL